MLPSPGEVVYLGRHAGAQFRRTPIMFRVIRVSDKPTYEGMRWIDGYELNAAGDAVSRRQLFVEVAGIRLGPPPALSRGAKRPTNHGPNRRAPAKRVNPA